MKEILKKSIFDKKGVNLTVKIIALPPLLLITNLMVSMPFDW